MEFDLPDKHLMVKSSFFVEQRPLTRADELHDQLSQLEAIVGRLGYGLGKEALTALTLFDSVSASLAEFQAKGQSLRAEVTRLETVSATLKRKAPTFLREIGGAAILKDARHTRQPGPTSWWWFLDDLIATRRRGQLRQLLRWAIGLAAVLLLLFALYQRFLAPDPATRERLKHEQVAQNLIQEGDLTGALSEVEQALSIAPENPDVLILKGCLQQELGQSAAAEETFAVAKSSIGDQEAFLLRRGQVYLLLGQAQAGLADAEAAVALNPQSGAAYLLLGRASESLENYGEAITAYEQAATLADAQGNSQIAATARVNMGILMQRLPSQLEQ